MTPTVEGKASKVKVKVKINIHMVGKQKVEEEESMESKPANVEVRKQTGDADTELASTHAVKCFHCC